MRTRQDFGLIETFGRSADGYFPRLERHLQRLARSAGHFGFELNQIAIRTAIAETGNEYPGQALRIRLELSADGNFDLAAVPFTPLSEGAFWRVAISDVSIDPASIFNGHKTTERSRYDEAREAFGRSEADEVLLLGPDDQLSEGTITNLFVQTGNEEILLTPPADSGLLPGILREELLESGKAREAVIHPEDLTRARRILVGNSLRGLIPVQLVAGPQAMT